jgi:uncharacterized protein involved in outer membrane biogenesis
VLLAIVLAAALLLVKDEVVRNYAEAQIRRETGFDARIGNLEISLFAPTITIEDFTLYNPAQFGGSPFLEVPELHIEYGRKELAFQRFHLKLLRLKVREMNIVQDKNGRTNLVELISRVSDDGAVKEDGSKGEHAFSVDMLNLSVGKIRFTDLQHPARNHEVNLRLHNEIVPNVRSEQDLARIFLKILLRGGITIYFDTDKPKAP